MEVEKLFVSLFFASGLILLGIKPTTSESPAGDSECKGDEIEASLVLKSLPNNTGTNLKKKIAQAVDKCLQKSSDGCYDGTYKDVILRKPETCVYLKSLSAKKLATSPCEKSYDLEKSNCDELILQTCRAVSLGTELKFKDVKHLMALQASTEALRLVCSDKATGEKPNRILLNTAFPLASEAEIEDFISGKNVRPFEANTSTPRHTQVTKVLPILPYAEAEPHMPYNPFGKG